MNDIEAGIHSASAFPNNKGMVVGRNDPIFVAGVDDIALPLKDAARELQVMAERLRKHVLNHPKIRLALRKPGAMGTPESHLARRLLTERRLREQLLDVHLFGEPAWDILLDLFATHEENARVSVSSLCIAAAVPATTALRWINAMTRDGILVRYSDPNDRRRIWIALAPHMVERMRRLLRAYQPDEFG